MRVGYNGGNWGLTSLTGGGTFGLAGTGTFAPIYDGGTAQNMSMSQGGLFQVVSGNCQLGYGYAAHWINNQAGLMVNSGATFDLWDGINDGNGIRFDALSGSGTITETEGTNANTLYLGVAGGSGTFGGVITNKSGWHDNLIKSGTGIQTLAGTNTYTGTTTVSGGTLQFGNGGTTGLPVATNITNNAMLGFNLSNAGTVTSTIGGSGSIYQTGGGTTTVTGAVSYTGRH